MVWSRISLVLVCVLAIGLWVVAPADAQTQTGNINGTVRSPDGEVLPGVAVTLSGEAVMGTKTAVTGSSGGFRFPALLPNGAYIVEFTLDGFNGRRFENIVVQLGQTTTLPVVMELAAVAAEISITAESPIVDVTSPTASTHFNSDLLDNIPNPDRNWATTVFQTPGVTDGSQVNYDQMYSNRGGAVIANQVAIDGVTNTLPVYNVNVGSGTAFEAVEELQVVSGALPAELGNMGGTYVNVVTKSGGNQFRGEVGAYYTDSGMQGDNVDELAQEYGIVAPVLADFHDYGLDLGGPIVRDKLWFHGSWASKRTQREQSGFPYPIGLDKDYASAKLTWQPRPSHNIVGLFNTSEWFNPWTNASEFRSPESTIQNSFQTDIFKVKWTGILSDNVFMEADVARRDTDQQNAPQPDAGTAYTDLATSYSWGGGRSYVSSFYRRDMAKASLSWFKDDLAGSHQFKFGLDYEDTFWDRNSYQISPVYAHYLWGGAPLYAQFTSFAAEPLATYFMEGLSAFVQDTWTVSDRVTLSLGVRMNTWEGGYPDEVKPGFSYGPMVNFPGVEFEGDTAVEWTVFDPRLGATIALDDQGKTALRIGLARYHHGLDLVYFINANPSAISWSLHFWTDTNGDVFADPDELSPVIQGGGGAIVPIDPELKNPYTDEFTISFEKELFTDFALTINATWREDGNLIDDVNSSATEDSFVPVDVQDPGPDGEFGTDDDQTLTMYNQISDFQNLLYTTNPELAKRDYKGVEVIATKRLSNNWQALASITWGEGTGTLGTRLYSGAGFAAAFNDPNSMINLDGPVDLDTEWMFKVSGTYLAPLGFSFSGYYSYRTGFPLYRTFQTNLNQGPVGVIADPKSTHLNDSISRLDLRAEKTFSFGSRPVELGLILDVFNTFNNGAYTSRNSGTLRAGGFGRPLAVEEPRTLRVGARVRF